MAPSIRIFDPADFVRRTDGDDSLIWEDPASADGRRDRFIATLADDPRGGERDLLIADETALARLDRLAAAAPNFVDAIGVVARAAAVSHAAGTALRLPPLLLVGEPGVGKSYFSRELAEAFGTPFLEHAMTGSDDSGALIGHSVSWRGARAGLIARLLIDGPSAAPVIFVDEIDKATWNGGADPLDPFHILLEPQNARKFVDAYLEAPINAEHILWIAAANDITALRTSLLDRFLVLSVRPPHADERAQILRRIYAKAAEAYGDAIDPDLDEAAVASLAEATPRKMRLLIDLAVGLAFAAGRRRLDAEDISAARRLLQSRPERTPVGFLAPSSR